MFNIGILHKKIIHIIVVNYIFFLSACFPLFPSYKDLTHKPIYHLGFKPGEVYLIKNKVYLVEYEDFLFSHPGLGGKPSFDYYRRDRDSWPDIIGIVEVGTEIKVTRLIEKKTIESRKVLAYAEITGGDYKGKEVLLSLVSIPIRKLPHDYPSIKKYDPEYLTPKK